jgi:hypothetical protein
MKSLIITADRTKDCRAGRGIPKSELGLIYHLLSASIVFQYGKAWYLKIIILIILEVI